MNTSSLPVHSSSWTVLFACAINTVGFTEVSPCMQVESYILVPPERGLLSVCIQLQGGLLCSVSLVELHCRVQVHILLAQ